MKALEKMVVGAKKKQKMLAIDNATTTEHQRIE
jgi:hypothetical protein